MSSKSSWPGLVTHYVATNSEQAMANLILSLSGDSENTAKSHLLRCLQEFMVQSRISDESRQALIEDVRGDTPSELAVQALMLHDLLASAPDDATLEMADEGTLLAEALNHEGLRARFRILKAQLLYTQGRVDDARRMALSEIDGVLELAKHDSDYFDQLRAGIVNTTTFCFLAGDIDNARRFAAVANHYGFIDMLAALAAPLVEEPQFPNSRMQLEDKAGDYLEASDTARALVWLKEAESRALVDGDEKRLCGLLGDLAVAFRRAGNNEAAVATYTRAIELCRKHHDTLNLARWSGNLGSILLSIEDVDGAEAAFKEAFEAAQELGDGQQMSIAFSNLSRVLISRKRFAEAVEQVDAAIERSADDAWLRDLWTTNRVALLRMWGDELRREKQYGLAQEKYLQSLESASLDADKDRLEADTYAYLQLADAYERSNELESAIEALRSAKERYLLLGESETAEGIESAIQKMLDLMYGDSVD